MGVIKEWIAGLICVIKVVMIIIIHISASNPIIFLRWFPLPPLYNISPVHDIDKALIPASDLSVFLNIFVVIDISLCDIVAFYIF